MRFKYVVGIFMISLFAIVSGCSDGPLDANVENCKSENLRKISDEHVMWKLSGECRREGVYKLNS